jgi:light-regulated signal transduction histidine kinase (bacteriophytochrome)
MNAVQRALLSRYTAALSGYLERGAESDLLLAYELGRSALSSSVGVLDMAVVHHEALRRVAGDAAGTDADAHRMADLAAQFFAESLSSFEMTLRGYRESNERLLAVNERLEQANAAVEATNRELEAFTYSVSHDLRAPLRGIGGFTKALLEDYADQLDGRATQYLTKVCDETQRMGRLIDGLLALSRVSRVELHPGPVDLAALAREIVERLARSRPEREVDVAIPDTLPVLGDAGLLTIALENLLNNAWKFTGRRTHARITMGRSAQAGGPACFVHDNGAGFDMAYAEKLFGVFQRLHSQSEFEGTGIGLSIAQRIVHRHGGRIWADSSPGQGATFYFTLLPGAPIAQ